MDERPGRRDRRERMERGGSRERRERGYSLAEMLVVVTLGAVVIAVALTLYERLALHARRILAATEQLQNTRAALERVVADLRSAGLNHNPDGDPYRASEAIEAAWETALVIRADLDRTDPLRRSDPESTLAGDAHTTVSIGNDEIRGYALGRPEGGGVALGFVADVRGVPRDGEQEEITMSRVRTTQDLPPYTLYRYNVGDGGTSMTRRPVADRLSALRFEYADREGAPVEPGGGGEDEASHRKRSSIGLVTVRLTGWSRDAEAAERVIPLGTSVAPRGIGLVGTLDLDPDAPGPPGNVP